MNNKIILNYIKANLGKDLNDNFNELGCAQTVNNLLKNCLGYVAGGGASTAKMLEEIVSNPNFKEVTRYEAQAGDIILSATGTGNGKVAHGHVGFLGENGVIYSNNSAKDCLDDHWTAQAWKNYYAIKGGFSVRYFRAVGTSLLPQTGAKIPDLLQSSQDPSKISLTVKGVASFLVLVSAQYGLKLTETDINAIASQIILLVPIIMTIWGLIRKYI
jgi:hypothetical protein